MTGVTPASRGRSAALRAEPQASQAQPAAANATLLDRFIARATRGIPIRPVVNFQGKHLFDRYEIMRWDEWPDKFVDDHNATCTCPHCPVKQGRRPMSLPWWRPFNAFLHHWNPEEGATEEFHDHPRWSVTICLKGRITEVTPWRRRELRPGSIVLRSRSYIHRFEAPIEDQEVWTLFIVGRRRARQNTFRVEPQ